MLLTTLVFSNRDQQSICSVKPLKLAFQWYAACSILLKVKFCNFLLLDLVLSRVLPGLNIKNRAFLDLGSVGKVDHQEIYIL